MTRIWDSSVGVALSYGLDGKFSIPDDTWFSSSPHLPDGLWGPPILLDNGHRGEIMEGSTARE
jgi:hypothetical protein